jgi:hypothetical protein
MALYQAGSGSLFYGGRLYRPGMEVEWPDDKKPPQHLIPVDDKAKQAYASHYATEKQVPQSKPKAPAPEPLKLSMSEHREAAEKTLPMGAPKKQ